MSSKVELYDGAYGNYEQELYARIRRETYGVDFGQTSWVTNQESRQIPKLLQLKANCSVLEVGCGSGHYAVWLAKEFGCRVTGLDINENGVRNARILAARTGLESAAEFSLCDVGEGLPFPAGSFDAVFSNDAFCHIPARQKLLAEAFRVLKPGGRLLFSDALVIGGLISHEEIAARTSIGHYVFAPPGENERLLRDAGFQVTGAIDTTASAAEISNRWLGARQERQEELQRLEGRNNFEGLQLFLQCVHTLTSERRLLRFLYLAQKPE